MRPVYESPEGVFTEDLIATFVEQCIIIPNSKLKTVATSP